MQRDLLALTYLSPLVVHSIHVQKRPMTCQKRPVHMQTDLFVLTIYTYIHTYIHINKHIYIYIYI